MELSFAYGCEKRKQPGDDDLSHEPAAVFAGEGKLLRDVERQRAYTSGESFARVRVQPSAVHPGSDRRTAAVGRNQRRESHALLRGLLDLWISRRWSKFGITGRARTGDSGLSEWNRHST